MKSYALIAASLIALVPQPSRAAEVLTGKDAAYIDWAARNCAMKSTPKEHGLIDAARAKGAAAFEKQYMQQAEDKQLAAAASSAGRIKSTCEDITSWYGRSGSRIEGLIQPIAEPTAPAPSSPAASAKRPDAGPNIGGKRK